MTRPLPAATTLARPVRPSRLCLAVAQVCIVLGMPTAAGNAQAGGGATASVASAQTAIRAGERLSDWLLRNPPGAGDDPAALAWQVPSARQAQAELKQALLAQLWSARDLQADETTRQRLADWLRSLPVTGRVPLAIVDARWLQANPDQDPILAPGHALVLPQRPGTVTLLADDGRPCAVAHRPGTQARGYLQACIGGAASEADMAWIVQPDGRVQRFGIATWNAEPQSEPAPGAWIWAPRRSAAWPEDFSDRLATFLATQSPTPIAARAAPTQTTTPLAARAAPAQTGTLASSPVGATPVAIPPSDPTSAAGAHDERPIAAHGAPTDTTAPAPPPVGATQVAISPSDPVVARPGVYTANDWGFIGLLQTPTARMSPAGELRFHLSRVEPYTRGSVVAQPFDWLEAGFRYTSVSNRLYGPQDLSGSQSYKDKSIDFKLRLAEETAYTPQLAFGMTDIGGTGLFSGEYLVASKRSGDFDWSLGLGWGYVGNAGRVKNPFTWFDDSFAEREEGAGGGSGGEFSASNYFKGRTSFFGGVQYAPSDDWVLKLEYDGNDYQNEPQGNNQKHDSPFNVGVVYRYASGLDLTAGLERGNTLMLGLTLHGSLADLTVPKLLDPSYPRPLSTYPAGPTDWARMSAEFTEQTRWPVREVRRQGTDLQLVVEEPYTIYLRDRIDRAVAVLHRHAPADVRRFVFSFHERGLPLTDWVVLRDEWVARQTRYRAHAEQFEAVVAAEHWPAHSQEKLWAGPAERFSTGLEPSYSQSLGGPDGFILFQLGITAPTELRLADDTWLSGRANLGLVDNYDKFEYDGPSNLPRVRTDIRKYVTESDLTLPTLQLNHVRALGTNQYASLYGGYLEPMFAGVGGEWLYRPWNSHFAFGIDLNHVRQRDFDQHFGLRDYDVTTGHATLYWHTGWENTLVKLSAGQYLAGDRGVTVDIARQFDNGVKMGVFATKTDVSAEEFGEGSFDKGIYLSIPFDAMLPFSSARTADIIWRPLTRDGGAMLSRTLALFDLTRLRDRRAGRYAPAGSQAWLALDDDREDGRSIWGELGHTGGWLAGKIFSPEAMRPLLLGAGLTGLSATLDRPLADWADEHQGGSWDTLGEAASLIPFGLAAGAGALWMGLADDAASDTARTSLLAAGWTLGAQLATKYAVNRARPEAGLGPHEFRGPGNGGSDSSFPSIHMGVAFALATPFAQKYDAPWLYGLAAATGFGRIQERQHFFSDVVAGSLMGYGIASLLVDEQRSRDGPVITLGTDRSLQAHWKF